MSDKAWKIFLGVSGAALLFYLLHLPPTFETLMMMLFSTAGTVCALAGLLHYRPQPAPAWIFLISGQALNSLGDLFFTQHYYMGNPNFPILVSNSLYSLAMVSFLVGIFYLFIHFRRLIKRNAMLNGVILAIGLGALLWVTLVSPKLDQTMNLTGWLGVVIFPLGLLVIGVIASIFLMSPIGGTWAYRFLYLTILFYAIGLNCYGAIISHNVFSVGWPQGWLVVINDASYSAAYIFLGTAFLHPSIKDINNPAPENKTAISRQDLLILGLAFILGPLAYLVQSTREVQLNVVLVLIGMIAIFTLVEYRLAQLVRLLESQNRTLFVQQEQLQKQAYIDPLTGLPNRLFLTTYLPNLDRRIQQDGLCGAVLLIDLNNFKKVNDLFGHDQGDIALREIALNLTRHKRRSDLVARWGGDEFLFVLENLGEVKDAMNIAERLSRDVGYTYTRDGQSVHVTLSLGLCLFPAGRLDIHGVIKRADTALYRAKKSTGEQIVIDSDMALPGAQ